MKTKTNGVLNFFYRIFIEVEEKEEGGLNIESSDKTEVALAKSQAEMDEKYKKHFAGSSGKGKSQFKVEESQLNKEESKETKQEEKGSIEKEDEPMR